MFPTSSHDAGWSTVRYLRDECPACAQWQGWENDLAKLPPQSKENRHTWAHDDLGHYCSGCGMCYFHGAARACWAKLPRKVYDPVAEDGSCRRCGNPSPAPKSKPGATRLPWHPAGPARPHAERDVCNGLCARDGIPPPDPGYD